MKSGTGQLSSEGSNNTQDRKVFESLHDYSYEILLSLCPETHFWAAILLQLESLGGATKSGIILY